MGKDVKQQVLGMLDERLAKLRNHQHDRIVVTGNQYEELNQALSKVIGVPLIQELEDIRRFVCGL